MTLHLSLRFRSVFLLCALFAAIAFAPPVTFAYDGHSSLAAGRVATPQGPAFQTATAEARAALQEAQSGATVYRPGSLGTQRTAEAQYWSFQNPASTPGYANKMGMPSTGSDEFFIMGGRVNTSVNFITREAPGVGGNLGGSVEAVSQPDGVIIDWFHMP